MTISKDIEAQILRYYHVEKWRVGTIARQLHIHHSVVCRVLSDAGIPKVNFLKQETLITPYLSFITETLTKYPALTASRLYEMVRQRGYSGGVDHFRHRIALYRPRKPAEAYLRLRTLPGEQAQVDWGHFGYIDIGKARRPLMAFVMVLSYSRKIFLQFYLNQQMANFLRGHEAAFAEYRGVPRVCLYDNLRSAVLERQGDAIRFNPTLLEFAAHYRYEPRPVAVARGNEKGRVERAIRYVRDNFWHARTWKDLDDLNQQASVWCNGVAAERPCPEDRALSVQKVFLEEQQKLLMLPDNPYPTHEREEVRISKTPYARFDLNDYSVPHTHVRTTVTVCATLSSVSILDATSVLATHPRCFGKGEQIENENHIADLTVSKKQARQHRGQDRLRASAPASRTLLIQAAERGYNIGSTVAQLLQLLNDYGAYELNTAIEIALSNGVPHPNAVRISLEKQREERQLPPPVSVTLPDDKRVRELVIRPHSLESYDQLHTEGEHTEGEAP